MTDPTGMSPESDGPIFDSKTGEFLGWTDQDVYGEVLFMDKFTYALLRAEAGVANNGDDRYVSHSKALENSISLGDLPNTSECAILFHKAVNYLADLGYENFYESDPTKELALGKVHVWSNNLNGGKGGKIGAAERMKASWIGLSTDMAGVILVTFNFDQRSLIDTYGNILSLFEHEFKFHGLMHKRNKFGYDAHKDVYELQIQSEIFQQSTAIIPIIQILNMKKRKINCLAYICIILVLTACHRRCDEQELVMEFKSIELYLKQDGEAESVQPPIAYINLEIKNNTSDKKVFTSKKDKYDDKKSVLILLDTVKNSIITLYSPDTEIILPYSISKVVIEIKLDRLIGASKKNESIQKDFSNCKLAIENKLKSLFENSLILYLQNPTDVNTQRILDKDILPVNPNVVNIKIPKEISFSDLPR